MFPDIRQLDVISMKVEAHTNTHKQQQKRAVLLFFVLTHHILERLPLFASIYSFVVNVDKLT